MTKIFFRGKALRNNQIPTKVRGVVEGTIFTVEFPPVPEKAPKQPPKKAPMQNKSSKIVEEKDEDKEEENNVGPNEVDKDDVSGELKHVSFDSYLQNNFSQFIKPKEKSGSEIPIQSRAFLKEFSYSYKLNRNCKNHAPYPQAMCSSCIPPSIHMKRQVYRHVDYAQIMNGPEVGNLIRHWFNTGAQRVGYLYGYYAEDPTYPMGVRAIIEGIYEPPQKNDFNTSVLLHDDKHMIVDKITKALGLQRIGYVFTTYNTDVFLTADEVIWLIICVGWILTFCSSCLNVRLFSRLVSRKR